MSRRGNGNSRRLSRKETERVRLANLRQQLEYCYQRSEFFKNRFDQVGFRPDDIRTWEDFRRLPVLMTKDDERTGRDESLAGFGHPFGMHLCVPPGSIVVSKTTSGTTGTPTFSYSFTRRDIQRWNRLFARAFRGLVQLKRGDRLLCCFPLSGGGGSSGGLMTGVFTYIGALTIDIGAEAPAQKVFDFARLTRPNVLVASPSLAEILVLKYQEMAGRDIKELGFVKLLLSGEPGIAIPAVKRRMEDVFGAKWYDFLAANGEGFSASCGTEQYHGLHEVAPEWSICIEDLVDPVTRKPVEVGDGAVGEAVLTSLGREGAPYIKYASGDVYRVFTRQCECGFAGPGYTKKLLGRVGDMLLVGNTRVFATEVREVVASFMPRVTGGMRIVLRGPLPEVEPPLRVKVERGVEVQGEALDTLRAELVHAMRTRLGVVAEFELMEPYSLERALLKTPLFERR
ncbi:MAG: phenylacetate--CoA ligase family protein [Chloroflexota bacterium]